MKSINMCHSRKHPISCVQDRRPQRESVPLIRNDLGLAMTAPMNTFLIISTEAFPVGLCRYTYRFIYVQCSLVNILQKAFSHKTLFPSVPVFFISTLPQQHSCTLACVHKCAHTHKTARDRYANVDHSNKTSQPCPLPEMWANDSQLFFH